MFIAHKSGEVLRKRYQIRQIIGQGGMGNVYLAEDLRLTGRLCAIKEVKHDPTMPADLRNQTREQFFREATVLARLDHPNLPKVSDFFSIQDRDYLVMDYVPGKDLRTLIIEARQHKKFIPERDVLNWASQLSDAIDHLHHQDPPILHRDIKPSNIKLTPAGVVKLVDFGLVKLMSDDEMTITVVQGRGTVLYTPLEQYGGDAGHTDPRTDIYALGATLYHLLTNHPPIEARERFLHPENLPALHSLNPNISPRTERIISWAMSLHPDDRPANIETFKQALLGDWNPSNDAARTLPTPSFSDLLASPIDRMLMIITAGMVLVSLIATLGH